MNKKLIAIAVAAAGMAAPMVGQASVTPYGNLQVEIANVTNDGYGENNTKNSRKGMAANQSGIKAADNKRGRLGFKTSEDLGGGLKAIAKFEWQVDTVYGNINDGAREGWVGMKGSFGEIKAGRIKSPYKYTGGVKYDPFTTTYLEARKSGGSLGGAWGQNSFWDTSVSYKGKWGGLSAWVNYGLDSGDGTNNYIKTPAKTGPPAVSAKTGASDAPGYAGDYAVGVRYDTKTWEVFGVTESNPTADSSGNSWGASKVGGKIKLGASTFFAQYESISDKTGASRDKTYAFLGYHLKMGKSILVANIGRCNSDKNTCAGPGKVKGKDANYYAVGLIYRFSKKTRIFTGYRSSNGTDVGTNKNDLSLFTVGMRVDF